MHLSITVRALGLLTLAASASAQTKIHTHSGTLGADRFGFAIADLGDVDADGIGDYVVGAPGDETGGFSAGRAIVYSGRTKAMLYEFFGANQGEQLGYAVSDTGDIDADGVPDFAVGAWNTTQGTVVIHSGANGAPLATYVGLQPGDGLGISLGNAGDVNNDGVPDLVSGAFRADVTAPNAGSIQVYSGQSGALLYAFHGDATSDELGRSVSGAGDVNNDGYDDFMGGTSLVDTVVGINVGITRVFSGQDGALIHQIVGAVAGDFVGSALSDLEDVDNDGFDDYLVGAYGVGSFQNGQVMLISGQTGQVLFSAAGDDNTAHFGIAVAAMGDVDGDGVRDVVVGANQAGFNHGYAEVYSGATFALLGRANGTSGVDDFGRAVSGAGDTNGDGIDEFLVGAPDQSHAHLWTVNCGSISAYGVGCAGASGPPELSGFGCAVPGESVGISLTGGVPDSSALFLIGLAPVTIPLGAGCTLLVQPSPLVLSVPLSSGGSAFLSAPLPVPTPPISAFVQGFVIDPGATLGFAATNGVEITVE